MFSQIKASANLFSSLLPYRQQILTFLLLEHLMYWKNLALTQSFLNALNNWQWLLNITWALHVACKFFANSESNFKTPQYTEEDNNTRKIKDSGLKFWNENDCVVFCVLMIGDEIFCPLSGYSHEVSPRFPSWIVFTS